jgi:hypothetical protein
MTDNAKKAFLKTWFQAISAAPLVSNTPEYSPKNISAGVRNPSRTLGRLFNASVICNPVVQIAAFKQPVYCAQFPAVFQG